MKGDIFFQKKILHVRLFGTAEYSLLQKKTNFVLDMPKGSLSAEMIYWVVYIGWNYIRLFFLHLMENKRKSTFLPYRVKKYHSILEMDTFKVMLLIFYLVSLNKNLAYDFNSPFHDIETTVMDQCATCMPHWGRFLIKSAKAKTLFFSMWVLEISETWVSIFKFS